MVFCGISNCDEYDYDDLANSFERNETLLAVSLSLILGGAMGNLIDRLAYGYVIDFLDVYYGTYHWPAFNIADSAITIGVALMLVESFKSQEKKA